ncbi:MAG: hypothetical protein R3F60_18465 [bacterium]
MRRLLLLLCLPAWAGAEPTSGDPGAVRPPAVAAAEAPAPVPDFVGPLPLPPEAAIVDAATCRAAHGKWMDGGRFTGCQARGQRQGWWSVFDEEDGRRVMRARALLVDGLLDGPSTDYHENGEVAARGQYTRGEKSGTWQGWHPGGQDRFIESYDDQGRRQGPTRWWYANCVHAHTGGYVDDLEDGHWKRWLATGTPQEEGDYTRGVRTGTWTFWHKKGPKLESGPYVDGKRQGTWTEWTFQGHRWRTVEYVDDQRQGEAALACVAMDGSYEVDHEAREDGCMVRGRRAGLWAGYYPDGKLMWTATYDDGREQGVHTDYHPTGEVLREGRYEGGVPVGAHVFRRPDGSVIGESALVDGTGEFKIWWANGHLRERGTYTAGLKDGVFETWFETGNPDEAVQWIRGRADGETQAWFATGEPKHRGFYKGGRRFGVWTAWYVNGQVAWEGEFDVEGSRVGDWREGHWEAVPKAAGPFAEDDRNGAWKEWHNNGKEAGEGPYLEGEKDGLWTEWWYSGEPWRTVEYKRGVSQDPAELACVERAGAWKVDYEARLVGCQTCRVKGQDEQGNDEIELLADGEWRWWHPNGQLETRAFFRRGEREGPWEQSFDDGRPMMKGAYSADEKAGDWQGWYRGGSLRFSGEYQAGVEDGAWTSFHPDGSRQASGAYHAGKKAGPWTWWSPAGDVEQTGAFADGLETGEWITRYPGGREKSKGSFVRGHRVGTWQWWREDGSPWRTETYPAEPPPDPPAAPASTN